MVQLASTCARAGAMEKGARVDVATTALSDVTTSKRRESRRRRKQQQQQQQQPKHLARQQEQQAKQGLLLGKENLSELDSAQLESNVLHKIIEAKAALESRVHFLEHRNQELETDLDAAETQVMQTMELERENDHLVQEVSLLRAQLQRTEAELEHTRDQLTAEEQAHRAAVDTHCAELQALSAATSQMDRQQADFGRETSVLLAAHDETQQRMRDLTQAASDAARAHAAELQGKDAELGYVKREYFNTLTLAIKLYTSGVDSGRKLRQTDVAQLYEQATAAEVPVASWPAWVSDQMLGSGSSDAA